jgi:methionine synthase I (cobalamin-dependent)
MMKNLNHAPLCIRAAASTGLPLFLGISTRIHEGQVVLFGTGAGACDPLTKEIFTSFVSEAGPNLVGVNVMHTNFSAMLPTLRLLRSFGYEGILGCYPDHGHFVSPHWSFEEVSDEAVLGYIREWVDQCGVAMIGGCCGLGPEYIRTVASLSK